MIRLACFVLAIDVGEIFGYLQIFGYLVLPCVGTIEVGSCLSALHHNFCRGYSSSIRVHEHIVIGAVSRYVFKINKHRIHCTIWLSRGY